MYSILLVDDEKTIADGITKILDLDELGFGRIETASNGIDALNRMHKSNFNVVIADIRMPCMDGLELLEAIRRDYPLTQVILITAFDKFEYVLRALRLGASNFILKPLNTQELLESLKSALANISENRFAHSSDYKSVLTYFMKRWCKGSMDDMELTMYASITGVNIFMSSFTVIALHDFSEKSLTLPDISQVLKDRGISAWGFCDHDMNFCVCGDAGSETENVVSILRDAFSGFGNKMYLCAVSNPVLSYIEVPEAFRKCMEALEYPSYESVGHVCPARSISTIISRKSAIAFYDKLSTQNMFDCLDGMDDTMLFEYAIAIISALTFKYPTCSERFREIACSYVQKYFSGIYEPKKQMFRLIATINSLIDDAQRVISPITKYVLKIIREHYDHPLSLKTLGDKLCVNPSYMGYLFKHETGLFFSEYLNQVRIQASKKLLTESIESIEVISKAVGYSNVRYFDRNFKLQMGVSPSYYRNMKRMERID